MSDITRDDVNVSGLQPHRARPAANYPIVRGVCPQCGIRSLFLGSGGFVTCANLNCPDPTAASDLLGGDDDYRGNRYRVFCLDHKHRGDCALEDA